MVSIQNLALWDFTIAAFIELDTTELESSQKGDQIVIKKCFDPLF
jgi:hypothetical protein